MAKTTKTAAKKKKKASDPAKAPPPMPAKTLVLRTCNADMTAHGGLVWPRRGPVECPDWDPEPKCGNGLHGLPWGRGNWGLLSSAADAVWQVVEVDTADLVDIDREKSKFPRGNVLFSGSRVEATIRVLCGAEAMAVARAEAEAWQEKSGDYSTAASSGDYSTAACDGASGIAASIGNSGMAKAGPNGLVIVTYWAVDEKRYRACVGNVGEGGILADTWYRVDGGALVAVEGPRP